jgi:hypothetical protein
VQIGGDKTNRDITVTVTVNGIVKRTIIHVGGSKLALSALPAAPQPNQSVTITANLKDAAGNAIQGTTVTFGGTIPALQSQTATTDTSGNASVTVTAPATAGVYTVTATGGGTPAPDYQLQVFANGSSVPAAVIPAGVTPSLAASPNVLAVNAVNSTTNKSVLRFVMLDAANNPIPNVRVRFDDMTTGLPAQGASLASGATTLFTDSSGSVSTQYIAGQNSSPTNGVTIRACYSANDFASGTDCPASVNVTLTVAGQALSISIGDDNQLAAENGMYIKSFAVTVADSAGRAVANAPVDISVDLTHFAKGDGAVGSILPLDTVPLSTADAFPALNSAPAPRVWCPNEDYNRNGVVDATTVFGFGTTSENYNSSTDSNGQPTLEPRKSDLLINYDKPTVTTTDANGVLVINVRYSQRFASWLAYKVRVTANVAGSQGMAERQFITDFLEGDKNNGSFLQPPYGVNRCIDPN